MFKFLAAAAVASLAISTASAQDLKVGNVTDLGGGLFGYDVVLDLDPSFTGELAFQDLVFTGVTNATAFGGTTPVETITEATTPPITFDDLYDPAFDSYFNDVLFPTENPGTVNGFNETPTTLSGSFGSSPTASPDPTDGDLVAYIVAGAEGFSYTGFAGPETGLIAISGTLVPEPASLALLAGGLGVVALRRRSA
ncbi:MAG: PEP-CTERM sorting domain-containing protein [Planctomycetota bacterium]